MKGICFIVWSFTVLFLSSCGQRGTTQVVKSLDQPSDITTPEVEAPDTFELASIFENSFADLEPFMLCEQRLTSLEGMISAFPESEDDFFHEPTPDRDAFYFPKNDIKDEKLVRTVQLRYNYAALFNRVLHSYEWFERMSTMPSIDDDDEEEYTYTKKDTLAWIHSARPKVSQPVLSRALPDTELKALADMLLSAYDSFDGDDSEGSPFSLAMAQYSDSLSMLPELVSEEEKERFEKQFWDWYDKEKVVPGIDGIIKMNLQDFDGESPTDEQIESIRLAAMAERDIDRRTILALEYAKFDGWNGALLLGEILESRVYTKYLLEAWIAWRANVQMEHSPSSFSVIANNYFDQIRTICLDTMVRHCLQTEDKNTEFLIENMICCEIIHRMGSLLGNSSLATLADLSYGGEFIHPRLFEKE